MAIKIKRIIFILFLCCIYNKLSCQIFKDTTVNYINRIISDSEAITKINQLLEQKNNSVEVRAQLQLKLALRTSNMGKYEEVIKLTNEFIIEQEPKILNFIPRLYNTKAGAYYYTFNVDKAIESLEKGIEYAEKVKDYPSLYTMSSNLGGLLTDQASVKGYTNNYSKAEKILLNALKINEANNKEHDMQYYLTKRILAIVYQTTNRNKEAERMYLDAIEGFTKLKDFGPAYMGAMTFYAQFLGKQKRSNEAFIYLDKAIEAQRGSDNMKDLTALYYVASGLYKDANNKDKALLYLDSSYCNQLKEFEDVQNKAIASSEAKFGNEILKRDVQIANQKKQKYIFISGLIALLALLSGLVVFYRQKRKYARQKIVMQKQAMDAYLEGEEKEKIRLSRELHDGIAQDLLALRFAFQKQGVAESELYEIDKIGTEVRNLSHQLMPLTLKMMGLIPAIEEMCNKLFPMANIEHEIITSGIEQRLPLTLETSLYRILQELVQNIIKHSKANHVIIQLILKNNFINLIVEDNGTGFNQTKSSDGIGMHNLKSRVQMINGNLSYESADGDGTVTIVRVPVNI